MGITSKLVLPAGRSTSTKVVGYLYGPLTDFMLLGGGSIFVLIPLGLLWPSQWTPKLAIWMLVLANLINHPHFAHSYQLFYRNFRARAFGREFPQALRVRYLIAGVFAPLILVAFFTVCLMRRDVLALGYMANLMGFLVGWHYVKQGYGMLMLTAALKRSFFNEREKNLLRWNGYLVWITSWVLANQMLHDRELWGISYATFSFPPAVLIGLQVAVVVAALFLVGVFLRKRAGQPGWQPPINGFAAYAVSLYLWLLFRHPAVLFVVPAFHSLQYLAVVWRYQHNFELAEQKETSSRAFSAKGVRFHFALFVLYGFILGYLGFWLFPEILQGVFPEYSGVFGGALFLFLFWVFINIHHYFMDNVMWRKDNPDTRRYLFGAR